MPIILMNDTQYGFPWLIPNAELETEYVNPCRHCQPCIDVGDFTEKKDRPHTKIRLLYIRREYYFLDFDLLRL